MIKILQHYNVRRLLVVVVSGYFLMGCGKEQPSSTHSSQETETTDELKTLNQAVEARADEPGVYYDRALYYYQHNTFSESIRDLIICVELDSSNQDCWFLLADAYLEDNRSRLAIEALEDYLKVEPGQTEALLKLAEFQVIIKRYQAAHFNLNAILKKDPGDEDALLLKGLIYRYENKPLEAVEYLQQAVQINPDLADGHMLLGKLFEEAGNPMAQKYYENAIRIDPNNAEAKLALANYFWLSNSIELAKTTFNELLEEHPNFARGHYNLGLLFMEQDSVRLAEEEFEKAVAYDSDFYMAHYYLGETKILNGNLNEALPYLETAARLSPSNERINQKLQEVKDELNQ